MRCHSFIGACLAALLSMGSSLQFTAPASGSGIDPTQPLVISWTHDTNDPPVIDLKIANANPNVLTTELVLATGISSSAGTYTVPANTIQNFGTSYSIEALSDGATVAQITGLTLGATSGGESVSTDANGQLTLVASTTGASSSDASTMLAGTERSSSAIPTASVDSVGITTLSGSATGASRTVSGSITSTASRTSTESSAAATSADSKNNANAQRRLSGEFTLLAGAAGLLAGFVALLA